MAEFQASGVLAPGSLLPWRTTPPDGLMCWGQTCRTWMRAAPSTGSAGTESTSTRTPGTPRRHLRGAQPDGPRAEPPPALLLLLHAVRVRAAVQPPLQNAPEVSAAARCQLAPRSRPYPT